jgi:hypothetical protein
MKFIIPKNIEQTNNASKLLIRTIGGEYLKRGVINLLEPNEYQRDPALSKSYLGSNVLSNLTLEDKVTKAKVVIDTALFNVTQTKHIVTTPIQGRDGTVKEYISMGDYHINIKGVIAGVNGLYPKDTKIQNTATVQELLQMCMVNKALTTYSWFLLMFKINDIVITNFTLGQTEGEYSTQYFEITALSDTPFEVSINA